MDLFRGSLTDAAPDGVFSHFGTMMAAAQRLDSIYTQQNLSVINEQGEFIILDAFLRPVRKQNSGQVLESFACFMQGAIISKYAVDIKNPLLLTDCWMDDPIGSGALEIFQDNKSLTSSQQKELRKLFHPFTNVIYPQHVQMATSHGELKKMKEQSENDPLFKMEIKKRMQRSVGIGEPWSMAEPQELVWVDRTLKLRKWALENKYDAFVYKSMEEDKGSDCYVTLTKQSIASDRENYVFNKEKYVNAVSPVFDTLNKNLPRNTLDAISVVTGLYWAGHNPTSFWEKAPQLDT